MKKSIADVKIAINIVSYNALSILEKNLNMLSWTKEDPNFQIFLVDNSSADNIEKTVLKKYQWVKFKRNNRNLGFAAAHNKAYMMSMEFDPDFILLLNQDLFIPRKDIKKLIQKAIDYKDKKVGIIGSKLVNEQNEQENSIDLKPSLIQLIPKRVRKKIFFGRLRKLLDKREDTEVFSVTGALMLLNRKLIKEIGLFDERYFFYYEDTDLCIRAWRSGWKVFYSPEIEAVHIRGASTRTYPNSIYWSRKQSCISQLKYFSKHNSVLEKFVLKTFRKFELRVRMIFGYDKTEGRELLEEIKRI